MIEDKCPTCGQKVLRPDPPSKTIGERIEFEKEWDRRYREGQKK